MWAAQGHAKRAGAALPPVFAGERACAVEVPGWVGPTAGEVAIPFLGPPISEPVPRNQVAAEFRRAELMSCCQPRRGMALSALEPWRSACR